MHDDGDSMQQLTNHGEGGKILARVEPHLRKILPSFLARRNEDIKSMFEGLERGDYEAIRVFGHRMKGTGGAYGLDAISDIGRSLEQVSKEENDEEIQRLLCLFSDYLERVEVVYE